MKKRTTPKKQKPDCSLPIIDWIRYAPSPVVGVDEAGRGCLAGPVVAGAVILRHPEPDVYFDSKTLTEDEREELYARIERDHIWAVGIATVEEIDQLNILRASLLAMKRAVLALPMQAGHLLVDGQFPIPELKCKQTPLIQGDSRAEPVSAASIVAKVTRDRIMKQLAREYPDYGFDVHKGYGTPEHRRALAKFGPCPFHRRSFRGVCQDEESLTL